ncbi:MAG: YebC/PmpR family DNA-binding transcriptional regulator [Candidatus Dadabacteria bacterium]|nr:YebC/PmpR family DNA-binding transcriptional regulator [Candidatus Dadabacteria bacterium]NIS07444.1 YebC/PmpR family DNA-binding transcriptional regulator [Candidatus Dadabacteria bacterium]NIY21096.1 YebC/PmpR family DNA-binding transcriptional regulator [Candidatus Dadabacteria bacterium]
MSGHSKWANIKHKKASVDAKRGKVFTKLIRELTVAARAGGGDPEANPRLRSAINTAKGQNMPNDTIDRAIKRGTGEAGAEELHELSYEGYGPGGTAVLVNAVTDNKNRTVSEVRKIFNKHGGNMGEAGCVAWMFEKKGRIAVSKSAINEEELMELALDAGADDVIDDEFEYAVLTEPNAFEDVKASLEQSGVKPESAEVTMIPQNIVKVEGKEAGQLLRLMESLEDSDDVQNVYSNFDIPDEMLEAVGQ